MRRVESEGQNEMGGDNCTHHTPWQHLGLSLMYITRNSSLKRLHFQENSFSKLEIVFAFNSALAFAP